MVKKLSKVFVISFVFAIVIFLLGIYLGYSFDVLRISDVDSQLYENELNTLNYLSSKEFLDLFDESSTCESTKFLLENMGPEIADLGSTLTSYEKKNLFNDVDYKLLKIKYFLVELRAYVLFTKLKRECDPDQDLILYFYDQNHEQSLRQGYVLDSVVRSIGNVTIFSFDRQMTDSDVVELLVKHYNVTLSPTLIINDNVKLEHFRSVFEIEEVLEK